VRLAQLTKQHGDELAPAGEAARVPLGPVLAHPLLEFQTRKQLENLRKDAAYSVHGGTSSVEIGSWNRIHLQLTGASALLSKT
jgi:hypothetical protein